MGQVAMVGQRIESRAGSSLVASCKVWSNPGVFTRSRDTLSNRIEARLSLSMLTSVSVGERAAFGFLLSLE